MKRSFWKIFSVMATVMLLLTSMPFGVVRAAGNCNITVIRASQTVGVNSIFTVDIKFDTTNQEVDTAQAWLSYNPTYVQAVDGSGNVVSGTASGSITPGNMTTTGGLTQVTANTVDNTNGRANIVAGMPTGGTPAFGANYVLGTVRFKAVAEIASTPLNFLTALPRVTKAVRNAAEVQGTITNGTVTVQNLAPDLIVQSKLETWVTGQEGRQYTVSFVVKNNGSQTATAPFKVGLYIDGSGTAASEYTVSADMAGGATVSGTFTGNITLSGTSDTVVVRVDSGSAVTESNETNNELSNTWNGIPDLVVTAKSETWVTNEAGRTYNINFTLQNTGTADAAGGFKVGLYVNNMTTAVEKFTYATTLAAGATSAPTAFAYVATLSTVGSDVIKVVADVDLQVTEISEANNDRSNFWPSAKPDLVVTAKSETWVNQTAGTYNVAYTIANVGTANVTTPFNLTLTINSVLVETKAVQSLTAGGTSQGTFATYTRGASPPQSDTIVVTIDSGNVITEGNETNNTNSNLFPLPLPDLIVFEKSEAWVTNEAGGTYTVNYTIKNTGNQSAASGFFVGLYIDGSQTAAQQVQINQALAAGATATGSFPTAVTISAGSDTVTIVVDNTTVVTEISETNNSLTNTWPPPKPDLIVAGKSETAQTPTTTYKVNYTVKNIGLGNAAASSVKLVVDTVDKETVAVPALASGEAASGTFTTTITLNGATDNVQVVADSAGIITEVLETNNSLTNVYPELKAGIRIVPANQTASLNQIFTVQIWVDASHQDTVGAIGVDTVQTFLDFDPNFIKVVDSSNNVITGTVNDPVTNGTIVRGPKVVSNLTVTLEQRVNNTTGRLDLVVGMPTGGTPLHEDFLVATIRFKALQVVPNATLLFQLADPLRTTMAIRTDDVTGNIANGHVTINTADTTAPTVVSVVPANSATGVAVNTTVVVTFSETMTKTATQNAFSVVPQGGTAVAGAFAWTNNDTVMTFTPTAALAYFKQHTVTITTAATDVASTPNPMAANYVSTFTTVPQLLSIVVTPANPSIALGQTRQFTATGAYSDSTTANLTTLVTWSSGTPATATIVAGPAGNGGLATSVAAGTTTITATLGAASGNTLLTVTAKVLTGIQITPTAPSIAKGLTQPFTAVGTYSDGTTDNPLTGATWNSATLAVATINASGLATGVGVGSSNITAAKSGVTSNTAVLTVTAATLVSIAVTPANPTIALGRSQQFTATGTYTDATTQNLTGTATWTSSNTAAAAMSVATPGLATTAGKAEGTTTITATQGAVSGNTVLTVGAKALDTITVAPGGASIPKGQSQQFTVSGTYSDGSSDNPLTGVTWNSSSPAVATITTGGLANALTVGNTNITATKSGVTSNTAVLNVTNAALASIAITPTAPSIPLGRTQQFMATGTYTDASTADITASVTWNSATTTVAVFSGTTAGLALTGGAGKTTGTSNITAISGTVTSNTAVLTVTDKVLDTIAITPTAPSIPKGTTQQFVAKGTYSDGSEDNPLAGVTWNSASLAIATIDATTGLATGVAVGTSNITAAKSGKTSNTAVLTVTAAAIVSIAVTPANPTVALGRSQQFTATATYTDNTTGNITAATGTTWTSSDTTKAAMSTTTAGLATTMGKATGTTNITASAPKSALDLTVVTSPAAVLTVGPKVLDSIAVTPNAPSVAKGRTQQFTATGTYSDLTTEDISTTAAWASSNTSKATIVAGPGVTGGLATTLAVGNTNITASKSSVTSPVVVLNITGPVLDSIAISTLNPSIAKGKTSQFTATGTYSDNSTANLTTLVTWSSGTPATATIVAGPAGNGGLAQSVAPGTSIITAAYGGKTSPGVTLTVTAAVVESLRIAPSNPTIAKGKTLQLSVIATMSDGTTPNTSTATWLSADETKVAVSDFGVITGANVTTAGAPVTITATFGGTPCTTAVTVTAATLDSVAITGTASVAAGNTSQLTLTGTYSDTTTANLTASAAWSSSNTTKATAGTAGTAGTTPGLVTSIAKGTTTITAIKDGVRATLAFTVTDAALVNFTVTPAAPTVPVGNTVQFTATPNYSDGTHAPTVAVTWSSDKANVTIDASGLATAATVTAAGQPAIITATSGGKTGTTTMTVTTATLQTITVAPAAGTNPSVIAGRQQAFTATGTYTDGDRNITSLVTWTSSDTTKATISSTGGTATGVAVTTTPVTITATLGSTSGTSTLAVTAKVLDSITITPTSASIAKGNTQQFAAKGTYSDGSVDDPLAGVAWASSTGAATFNANVATGAAIGSTTITASKSGITSNIAALTVTAPVLKSIAVTPGSPAVVAGLTQQLTATGTLTDNTTVNISATAAWTNTNLSIASIDSAGLAKGASVGTTDVTAKKDGIESPKVTLTVTVATLTGITVTPAGSVVVAGRTLQFRAMATYTDGSVKEVTNATGMIWTSSDISKATIIPGTGLATGVATTAGPPPAPVTITATLNGDTAHKGTTTLAVTEAVLTSIAVTPSAPAPSVDAGKTQQFIATGTYSDASTATITSLVTWDSSSKSIAKIDAAGKAQSFAPGTTNISASMSTAAGLVTSPSVVLTVNPPVLDSITVTPGNPSLTFISGAGNAPTLQFTATGNLSDGTTSDLTSTATWASDILATATIIVGPGATGGRATTVAPGTTNITAAFGGKTSPSSILTVLADTVAPVVTLTSPTEGTTLRDKTLTVSGNIDDRSAASVWVNGTSTALVIDAVTGNFSQGVLLNSGNNSVFVKATDASLNTGASTTREVVVNPNKPGVSITSPDDGLTTKNTSVTITGTVTGATAVTLRVNGTAVTPAPAVTPVTGAFSATVTLPEGDNIISASAYATGHDGDADYLGASGARTVKVDITAPVITVTSPASGSTVSTSGVAVAGTVNDLSVNWVMLILNSTMPVSVPVAGGNFSQNVTLSPPSPTNTTGANTILLMATDTVGNPSSTGVLTVYYDNSKPTVTITAPTNNLMTNATSLTVTGSTDELLGTGTLYLNGVAQPTLSIAPNGTFNQAVVLATGLNTIEVKVRDLATPPNEGTSGQVKVTLDTVAPILTINLTDPTDSITIMVSSDESLNALPTVTVGVTAVTMTRIMTNTWTGTYGSASSPIAAGDYVITVRGVDKALNATTNTATFSKKVISTDGISPTNISNSNTSLNVETNGPVAAADISVTAHMGDPSGNIGHPSSNPILGAMVELNGSAALQNQLKRIYVEVKYKLEELPPNTDPASLKAYYFDLTTTQWTAILPPDSGVDTVRSVIWFYITHMSTYGIFAAPKATAPAPAPGPAPVVGGGGPIVNPVGTTGFSPSSGVLRVNMTDGTVQTTVQLKTQDGLGALDIAQGTKIRDASGAVLTSLTSSKADKPATAPSQKAIVIAYEFGPSGAKFDPSITLTLTYDVNSLPTGVAEKDLVIAYYDGKAWQYMPTTVDTKTRTVSTQTNHFTQFAVVSPLPAPANFFMSGLSVTPATVKPGDTVTVTANVANIGGTSGKYTVVLTVNGAEEGRQDVTVNAGATMPVTFTVKKTAAATYKVEVNSLSGSFTVSAPPPTTTTAPPIPTTTAPPVTTPPTTPVVPPPGGFNWWYVLAIAAVIIVVLAVVFSRRRTVK